MGFIKKTISTTSTELEFMKAFINILTTTDGRIICETDENTINNIINNQSVTPMYIKINNSCKIKFKRVWTGSNRAYHFSAIINNKEYGNIQIDYGSDGFYDNTYITMRAFNFSVISNDNAIFISIGNWDNYSIPSQKIFILSVDCDNFTAVGVSNSFSSLNTLYCTDLVNTNQNISLINRLGYKDSGNDITNTIDSKVFVDTSSNTYFDELPKGLMDCSYMTSPSVISTNSGKFFTLNNYTLMPIKE